jgi:hypothetical protein
VPTQRFDDCCSEIIFSEGEQWVFDKKGGDEQTEQGNIKYKDALGILEDVDPSEVRCIASNEVAKFKFPDLEAFSARGIYTIAIYINLPLGGGHDPAIPLFHKGTATDYIRLEEYQGYLRFVAANAASGNSISVTSTKRVTSGKTYLVFVTVNQFTLESLVAELDIYTYDSTTEAGNPVSVETDSDIYVGYNDVTDTYAVLGTKFGGLLVLKGKVMTDEDKYNYAKNGIVPPNAHLVAAMCEPVQGNLYDASGRSQHGAIIGELTGVRVIDETFFPWYSRFGYSKGSQLTTTAFDYPASWGINGTITATDRVPRIMDMRGRNINIMGETLDQVGRLKLNAETVGASALQVRGGYAIETEALDYAFIYVINAAAQTSRLVFSLRASTLGDPDGDLICFGDPANPALKLYFSSNILYLQYGSRVEAVNAALPAATPSLFNIGIFYFPELGGISYQINEGDFGTIAVAYSAYDETDRTIRLFDAGNPLTNLDISFITFGTTSDFSETLEASEVLLLNPFYAEYNGSDFIASIPFNTGFKAFADINSPAVIENNIAPSFGGIGNYNYMNSYAGFNLMVYDLNDTTKHGRVINHVNGTPKGYNNGSSNFKTITVKRTEGMLNDDSIVDLNPLNKQLGFVTWFWDKGNTDVWTGLDNNYLYTDSNWWWHTKELNQTYFEAHITQAYRGFVFVGGRYDKEFNKILEIIDLVLLNHGYTFRHLPVPGTEGWLEKAEPTVPPFV